jgi:carotenoid 1,2-hydratase
MRSEDVSSPAALRVDASFTPRERHDNAARFSSALSGDWGRSLWGGVARLDGIVPPFGRPEPAPGPLPLRWQRSPRPRPAHGGPVGPDGSAGLDGGLGFDAAVPPGGYAWWYIDGLSADGSQGITLIAFIGSVFSPYYAWARRGGAPDATHYCALNVALYRPGRGRWAMTERGRRHLARDATHLSLGPSSLAWDGTALTVTVDERGAPLPWRLRGTVRLRPEALTSACFPLDAAGHHRWRPIAACSTVEVDFQEPGLRWTGPAYFDFNAGDAPLETGFRQWDWSRARVPGGTAILYDVSRRSGETLSLAMHVDRAGTVTELPCPPAAALPRTLWRLPRQTRADPDCVPDVLRTFEDTPFYARSLVRSELGGRPVTTIHESLSLDRFRAPWVQAMLPFRMPRVPW